MNEEYKPVDPAVRRAHLAQGAGLPHGAKLDEVADEVAGEALAARYARKAGAVITGEVVAGPQDEEG